MNKKGSATISLIAGAIIAVILLLIFILPKFRIFLIGLVFMFAGIFVATKGDKITRNQSIFALMFISIGIVIILFQGFFSQTEYGTTYLSIDSIDINGNVKIRTTAVTNGAENMVIDWTTNEMNSELSGSGYSTTKPVTGSINLINPKREFKITPDNSQIFWRYSYIDLGILKNCANNVPSGTFSVGRIGTNTCLYRYPAGNYAHFTGVTIDNTPVEIDIGGSTGIINPSSGDNVLTLNDGKTKVEWVGNMVNYKGLDTPYQYGVLQKNSQYLSLIDSNSYSNFLLYSDTFDDCIGSTRRSILNYGTTGISGVFKSDTISRACITDYNNKLTNTLADNRQVYTKSISSDINDFEFTSNGMVVGLNVATVFPVLTITLDASKVGLVELKGEPEIITCVKSQSITSGDTINPVLSVKNIGKDDGQFYGNIKCASGVTGTIDEQLVKKGQTVNMNIQLSGTNLNTNDLSSKCTYTIIDRKSQLKDSCSSTITIKYKANIVCEPKEVSCSNSKTLRTCNSDGTDFIDVICVGESICETNQKTGVSSCSEVGTGCGNGVCEASLGEDTLSCPNDCKEVIPCDEKTPSWLGWVEVTTEKQTIWTRIAPSIFKPKTETYCKATNAPYVFGGAVLIILSIAAFLIIPKKRVKGKSTKYGKVGK